MAFSGGGSNILKPHTHDSNVLQDGGNLNFQNVTQANMSAGSITYSNGSNLQELAIGTPSQILQVNGGATALEYTTSPANLDNLEIIGTHRAAGTESTFSFTGSWDLDADYSALQWFWSGTQTAALNLGLRLGGITTNSYRESRINQSSATLTGAAVINQPYFILIPSGGGAGYYMRASGIIQSMGSGNAFLATSNGARYPGEQSYGSGDMAIAGAGTVLDEVEFMTSASTWDANTQIDLYGLKI